MPGVDGPSAGNDQNGPSQNIAPKTTPKDDPSASLPAPTAAANNSTVELDDFGLPIRKYVAVVEPEDPGVVAKDPSVQSHTTSTIEDNKTPVATHERATLDKAEVGSESGSDDEFKDAASRRSSKEGSGEGQANTAVASKPSEQPGEMPPPERKPSEPIVDESQLKTEDQALSESRKTQSLPGHQRNQSSTVNAQIPLESTSEFSHQQLTTTQSDEKKKEDDDDGWQVMPAYAPYDIYDDDNKLIAKEYNEEDDNETYGYGGLGGAGKGYTKVYVDDDAESATSMDENTQYLFQERGHAGTSITDEEDTQRDAVSQLQATKDLLTEGQRIAYVGLTRLELSEMIKELEASAKLSSKSKKQLAFAAESMKMWSQKMMIRLYSHMDISSAEQVMIEQLSSHGVMPQDLTPVLMANARVKNPMADSGDKRQSTSSTPPSRAASVVTSDTEEAAEPPPPYSAEDRSELAAPVQTPSSMSTSQKIDIDLRWTVLCDLFLVLIADSIYDSRSRVLLERVAKDLEISWLDICRFEKKVTDALEMQQSAEKENWNEDEHMENRRKLALKRRYVMMGLATVGGGLVIGLSAGLLAPLIGAGLAAGFGTIGVGGTSTFLAGAGGAAVITSTAATSGSIIGVRAANRRTGAVKTFEYRPLHNNKRVNLIVTISGWMTGKVDDVRLPYSTVDPIMGDIYSVLWEPEMLTSMGDTINILATEALTQGLQQLLGSTVLVALMSALQLPVVLTKLSYLIDNPWAVSLDRATMAGLILADSLIDRNLGTRPVTLVGYSLGSRVIFSCLKELAKKGAFGLVQNVYLFGSPVVVKTDEYLRVRSVVSGRFVNGYNRNDWILGYLFRLTNGGIRRVAGLAAIEDVPGIENMDVSEFVVGHMDYRTAMPRLLRESGWMVESDEFTEIEDPDPENHQERQRELINEIEEARRELEKEGTGKKGGFGFFKRKKALEKQEWEVYEDNKGGLKGKTEDKEGNNHGVLFDVDAIRAELAKEAQSKDGNVDEELFQVKEIKSTLPPMKLDVKASPPPLPRARTPRQSLRETRSFEPVLTASSNGDTPSEYRPSHDGYSSPQRRRVSTNERAPTFPTSKAESKSYYQPYGYGGAHEEEEIQMTFDTGFEDPKPSAPAASSSSTFSKPGFGGSNSLPRPEMKTSQTVPNITLSDPWADDDDDFGKEKEIQMTFA
ncbi:hypothetical protein QBC35DRAFT_483027 [Podospora australis]|uniref:DUF726-domain-containing protein n=1 Tax=Podospora australis TaxID=1536484 RepID=A0AAN7AL30_9PEZI|nr:hypothetical protein QBC35DRAFT_483027 [Podospora australis]